MFDTNAPGSRDVVHVDGLVSGLDVKRFVAAIVSNGAAEVVPEPSTRILLAVGMLLLAGGRREFTSVDQS